AARATPRNFAGAAKSSGAPILTTPPKSNGAPTYILDATAPDGLRRPGVTRRDAADIFEASATLSPTRFVPLTLGLNRSRSLRASKATKRYRPASRALRTRVDDRVND